MNSLKMKYEQFFLFNLFIKNSHGMSIVGALVALAVLSIGISALVSTQSQFRDTAKDVYSKESVIQEATSKAAILQSYDFSELKKICVEFALNENYTGNCTNPDASHPHSFLYRWYNSDALTSLCLQLTNCQEISGGKILDVLVTASYKYNNKIMNSVIKFRKAK